MSGRRKKGGNRPHSNTETWIPKKETKYGIRKWRRQQGQKQADQQIKEQLNG